MEVRYIRSCRSEALQEQTNKKTTTGNEKSVCAPEQNPEVPVSGWRRGAASLTVWCVWCGVLGLSAQELEL